MAETVMNNLEFGEKLIGCGVSLMLCAVVLELPNPVKVSDYVMYAGLTLVIGGFTSMVIG